MTMTIHLFGVRHHGTGCARSLQQALHALQPDIILIEGPPEADALLPLAGMDTMQPPVALLIYAPTQPKHAVYFPFAVFSPEWQAILYGQARQIPTRFIDLPQAHQLAESIAKEQAWLDQQVEAENNATSAEEQIEPESHPTADGSPVIDDEPDSVGLHSSDALQWLATAAGFSDIETWWDHLVEQRSDSLDLFASIEEMMTVARAELGGTLSTHEAKREAHMRQMIRSASKEGFNRIAVVCGAWHVPALREMPSAKHDADLLKNLSKTKIAMTWTPWSYGRLAAESGYGAGIQAPGWYHHLWHQPDQAAMYWITDVARLLRKNDLDASSAHLIEVLRLAETLASLRERSRPGLTELLDATKSVLFGDSDAPLRLIERDLLINDRLGHIPPECPTLPLPADVKQLQKSYRLKVDLEAQSLELDLRQESHLEKSIFLHRLNLLGIGWGDVQKVYGKTGSFHEVWRLKWQPEFELQLIEANVWGATVAAASSEKLCADAAKASRLVELTQLIECMLLADAKSALDRVMTRMQAIAAGTHDAASLMIAIPPLAKVMRYGNVRNTNLDAVEGVLDGLMSRACIALPLAAVGINQEAAAKLLESMKEMDSAVHLLQKDDYSAAWFAALDKCATLHNIQPLIAGRAIRILTEQNIWTVEQTAQALSLACSNPINPNGTADWIEGFLQGSGMLLILNDVLLKIFNTWVASLDSMVFIELLPLLRRTFATFTTPERQQLGQRAAVGNAPRKASDSSQQQIDPDRAARVLPILRQIFAANAQPSA